METVATPDNLEAFLGLVIKAASAGQWVLVGALGLVFAVWGARSLLSKKYEFFKSGAGALLLNVLGSLAQGIAVAVMGAPASWAIVWAVVVSVFGTYGWTLLKTFGPLVLKVPFIAAMFPPKADGPTLVLAAEKQGLAAAVVAKAPTSDEIANGP